MKLLLFVSSLVVVAVLSQGVPVYVMAPLDMVSNEGFVNSNFDLDSQFAQLKSAGVAGILQDVWWGIVEQSPKSYNFAPYLQIAAACQKAGIEMSVIFSFHKCGDSVGDSCMIPLPSWVTEVGESNDGNIWYKDSQGSASTSYLSLGVDNEPIFQGRTALQCYQDYMSQFRESFAQYIESGTVKQVQVSLGPDGEMRYPSYRGDWTYCGIGEFQSYDSYMAASWQKAACAAGSCSWAETAGPTDAGNYNSEPSETGFFAYDTGTYNSPYGKAYLTWYSQSLLNHSRAMLSFATGVFNPLGVSVAGKIAGVYWWYMTASHAAELTTGYFNVENGNDFYVQAAAMFKEVGAIVDFTALGIEDASQPAHCMGGAQQMTNQVAMVTYAAGVSMVGENALANFATSFYQQMEQQVASNGELMKSLYYLRLGSDLLDNTDNWNNFKQFVSAMNGLGSSVELTVFPETTTTGVSAGVVVGGVCAALGVVLIVVGLVILRRRHAHQRLISEILT